MKIGDRIYVRGYIDEIRKDTVIVRNDGGYFGTVLSEVTGELPSAQPEYRLDEWCTDCKEYDTERHCCPRFNQVIRTTLDEMKSERKKGKWIDYTDDGYVECPFCHSATNCDGNKDELHYCFSCGADMRGE